MKHLKLLQSHEQGGDGKECVTEMTGKWRQQKVKRNRCMKKAPNRRWETVIETKQECVWHLNLLNLRMLNVLNLRMASGGCLVQPSFTDSQPASLESRLLSTLVQLSF